MGNCFWEKYKKIYIPQGIPIATPIATPNYLNNDISYSTQYNYPNHTNNPNIIILNQASNPYYDPFGAVFTGMLLGEVLDDCL